MLPTDRRGASGLGGTFLCDSAGKPRSWNYKFPIGNVYAAGNAVNKMDWLLRPLAAAQSCSSRRGYGVSSTFASSDWCRAGSRPAAPGGRSVPCLLLGRGIGLIGAACSQGGQGYAAEEQAGDRQASNSNHQRRFLVCFVPSIERPVLGGISRQRQIHVRPLHSNGAGHRRRVVA